MKILFINLPYYGHIIPTIGLVQELIKKGCEVTYLMPFEWEEKISESGAEFIGYDNHKQLSEQIKNAYAVAESIIEKYNFVPQLEVLKMADEFVTHGGMNSVSESLVYGTPMVVIPFSSDQPVNARCIEKLGVGKRLEYSDVNKDSIKEYVLSVLLDTDIKDNIAKVKKLIRQAPGNPGGAETIIDYYENM